MEKWDFGVVRLWRVYIVYVMACTSALAGCGLCLNEEGHLLFNWKQDSLQDIDDNLSNWNASDTTPCSWNGVSCNEGSVSVLDFSLFMNLEGPIDTLTFAKFTNLTTLNVGNTSLSGSFPRDIVNCSKLVTIKITWTYIAGEMPHDIINLQHLEVFDGYYASMVGTLDAIKFDKLQQLQVLRLGWNFYEGEIPLSVFVLTKLKGLSLSRNDWNGTLPLDFFKFSNLTALDIGSNLDVFNMVSWPNMSTWENMEELSFVGMNFPPSIFPREILRMTKLKVLVLERCKIVGAIPIKLENLNLLTYLDISHNKFQSGEIPSFIGNLTLLRTLKLPNTSLSGSIPSNLGNLKLLTYLDISINNLSGEIPSFIGDLTLLDTLYLSYTSLSGSIPSNLGNLKLLRYLGLSSNNLRGEIPSSLTNLTSLLYLDLSSNNLRGEIPSSLTNLTLLTLLDLGSNSLTGSIPLEFADLKGLKQFQLYNNNLTGLIPYNLGKKSMLHNLDLGVNLLEGPIPPYFCWGDNKTLQTIKLNNNKLIGKIPEIYDNCTNLNVVRFDGNKLEGLVPTGLWGGSNLERMQLNGNNFNGSIPPSIGNARLLSILDIQNNAFSGPIPKEIGQTSLVKFHASFNKLNGTLTSQLGNLSNLQQLGANAFTGSIPTNLSNCTKIILLDLSRNHLEEGIPSELVNLRGLGNLDFSENNLSGLIPRGLFTMNSLQDLNVAFNNLSGIIPKQGNGVRISNVNFTGNPYLCLEDLCQTNVSSKTTSSKAHKTTTWIIVGGVSGGMALGIIVMVILVAKKFLRYTCDLLDANDDNSAWTLIPFHNKVYHLDELTKLDEENVIGVGGSSKVYKVSLGDGNIVAVKKLWSEKAENFFDYNLSSELRIIASIQHRHIVKLLCCCIRRNSTLLVYEYMPNGSLGNLLHRVEGDTLSWDIRYKIALGAAKGLEYLHHGCVPQILHRDIKSNNILVDLEYEAHLADFSIAKMVDPMTSHDSSLVVGSLGYLPPEYAYGVRVTEKIDIYSYGVVLLELVSGKSAANALECMEETSLVQWVHNISSTLEGLSKILDPRCGVNNQSEMVEVLNIAISCTNHTPASRPSMRDVVRWLTNISVKPNPKVDSQ